jgi:hypothetical protein
MLSGKPIPTRKLASLIGVEDFELTTHLAIGLHEVAGALAVHIKKVTLLSDR